MYNGLAALEAMGGGNGAMLLSQEAERNYVHGGRAKPSRSSASKLTLAARGIMFVCHISVVGCGMQEGSSSVAS